MCYKVDCLSMLCIQIFNNRVVLMCISLVLITRRNTVTGNNSSVHILCRIKNCRKNLLSIYAIYIGVVKKSLALKHLYITNSRKSRELLKAFFKCRRFIYYCLIRCKVSSKLTDISSYIKTCHTNCMLIVVRSNSINAFADKAKVK